jgi:hypothetical protein
MDMDCVGARRKASGAKEATSRGLLLEQREIADQFFSDSQDTIRKTIGDREQTVGVRTDQHEAKKGLSVTDSQLCKIVVSRDQKTIIVPCERRLFIIRETAPVFQRMNHVVTFQTHPRSNPERTALVYQKAHSGGDQAFMADEVGRVDNRRDDVVAIKPILLCDQFD